MEKLSYLSHLSTDYIDELFSQYQVNPENVDLSWRYFFEGLELGSESDGYTSSNSHPSISSALSPLDSSSLLLERRVFDLIQAYRVKGNKQAQVNPLTPISGVNSDLELLRFHLSSENLSQTFEIGKVLGLGPCSLEKILNHLKKIYCESIAAEVTHVQNEEEKSWLLNQLEQSERIVSPEVQKKILHRLSQSEGFERFLHTRYVAQKRFSLEGAEALIPALDEIIETGGRLGAKEFVFGMAHRGRLNVLTQLFGKSADSVFTEFEGNYKPDTQKGEGDVKYHMGYSADYKTSTGETIHLSLAYNPSHLEFVNPVITGMVRAKQFQRQDAERSQVIPLAIHGDAAFSGQGICYETLNLAQLTGYAVGGTIHLVINNQVGFTTNPMDSRSTLYCTDIAKMLDAPIFHVNGDDPEALWFLAKLCMEYRQKFKKDIFIDMICYRKHGHNEADEPVFTQPLLYQQIKQHSSTRELYAQKLVSQKVLSEKEPDQWVDEIHEKLVQAQLKAKAENRTPSISSMEGKWKKYQCPSEQDLFQPVKTTVLESLLLNLSEQLNAFPAGFYVHPKLQKVFELRLKAIQSKEGIDWGNAEALAFASLLQEGYSVRLSGQDAERGTFSHRHATLHDVQTGQKYIPLQHLKTASGRFHVHNSHLSESGVLGFEYGYSITEPDSLILWEAQFGDFANGAQVIIDQFIASSESKWQRMTGLTLLLPHGYEGQGPEHSSARLERFLQLCGRSNQFVCNLSTPSQIFHALRRQMIWKFRKPLIIMSPKSLLRHPLAVSSLADLSQKGFQEVIDDPLWVSEEKAACDAVKKVLLCSGKIYYDLFQYRKIHSLSNVALVRVEQLYPWPVESLQKVLNRYPRASFNWVQEEPQNMGAWGYVFQLWSGGTGFFESQVQNRRIQFVGREMAAAPSVGSHKVHEKQQESLIQKAFL